jgi:hypothetical protein
MYQAQQTQKPAAGVPMSQIDAARATGGHMGAIPQGMPAPGGQPTAGAAPVSQAQPAGAMPAPTHGAPMTTRAANPAAAQMPAPAQGTPQLGAPADQAAQQRMQKLQAMNPQMRQQLTAQVGAQMEPEIRRAEQEVAQLRAQRVPPQQMQQALAAIDQRLQAAEASAIDRLMGA